MVINRDPQLDYAQRVRDFGVASPKQDVFIKSLPSRLRNLCRMRQRNCKSRKWWLTPRKRCLPNTTELIHVNSQGLWQDAQVQSRQNPSTQKEKWTPTPTTNHKAIYSWYLLEKDKSVSCKAMSLGVSATPQGRLRIQEPLNNTKGTPCLFVQLCFASFMCLGYCFLLLLLFWSRENIELRSGGR